MPVKLKNLTKRPVLLRLNSGLTLHLAPDSISAELQEHEINGNTKAKKLNDQNVIFWHEEEKKTKPLKKEVKEPSEQAKTNKK